MRSVAPRTLSINKFRSKSGVRRRGSYRVIELMNSTRLHIDRLELHYNTPITYSLRGNLLRPFYGSFSEREVVCLFTRFEMFGCMMVMHE